MKTTGKLDLPVKDFLAGYINPEDSSEVVKLLRESEIYLEHTDMENEIWTMWSIVKIGDKFIQFSDFRPTDLPFDLDDVFFVKPKKSILLENENIIVEWEHDIGV